MDAKSKPILNGGSGGLSTGSDRIVVGAGGLYSPAYRAKREEALKKLILVIVVAALAAGENGNQ